MLLLIFYQDPNFQADSFQLSSFLFHFLILSEHMHLGCWVLSVLQQSTFVTFPCSLFTVQVCSCSSFPLYNLGLSLFLVPSLQSRFVPVHRSLFTIQARPCSSLPLYSLGSSLFLVISLKSRFVPVPRYLFKVQVRPCSSFPLSSLGYSCFSFSLYFPYGRMPA